MAEIDANLHELPDYEKGVQATLERIINIIEVDVQIHHERGLDASAEYLIDLIARIKGENK
jgi:hypothetical protein